MNLLSKASLTLGRLPAEGILKLLASAAGIAAEFATGFPPNGAAFYASNQQHITMYREGPDSATIWRMSVA